MRIWTEPAGAQPVARARYVGKARARLCGLQEGYN